jgi:steroid delta-isomerase-like uncharacterized protein
MATVRELLERFVGSFNEGRFEEARDDYAESGVQEEIGTGRQLTVEEGIANARAWKSAFPDARGVIETMLIDGNRGAAEIVWTGTNTGSLNGMPPTGKPVTMRAVAVIETDGSRITRARHYLDVAGMMAQLGVAPGAQPAGTRA